MGRKRHAPRLWLDQRPGRGWVILDGQSFIRTGCAESDRASAEKKLAEYLGDKYKPQPSADPLIADMLTSYGREHLINTRTAKKAAYNVKSLVRWWGTKSVSDINPLNCKAYAATKSAAAARRDLEVLRAALRYWHKWRGPLATMPTIILPAKAEPRDRFMTKGEAARLLWAARHTSRLARFILLGLRTGSRSGVLFNLQWSWIDLGNGIMLRRAPGASEAANKRAPKVRLGRKMLGHLKRWRRIDGDKSKFVIHYNGQRITKGLQRSFAAAVKAAGLKGITAHIMRHSRATWLMQEGIAPFEAAGHLGMSMKTLTTVYGHHHPDFQKSAAEV